MDFRISQCQTYLLLCVVLYTCFCFCFCFSLQSMESCKFQPSFPCFYFCFQLCSLIFSIVSQSLLKTTQEPLPQDAVKRMLSFTGGGWGVGRGTVHGWIITPASSPSLHGFMCLKHLSFNKMFISVALICNHVQFCQTTSDAGLRAQTKLLFLTFFLFQFSVVLLCIVYVTVLCFSWHHYFIS